MDAGPRIAVIQSRSPMARSEVISLSGIENICIGVSLAMTASGVRREKAALSSGCKTHPATAPAGSNRSSYGGDEIAEAFGMRVTNW
jgi:hypothetical protein